MTRAIRPTGEFEYVRKEDRSLPDGHPEKPVFILRGLTLDEETKVSDGLYTTDGEAASLNFGSNQLTILRLGLKGWKNFNEIIRDTDDDGEPLDPQMWDVKEIEFRMTRATNGKVPNELLELLSGDARTELANAITSRNKPTPEEGN